MKKLFIFAVVTLAILSTSLVHARNCIQIDLKESNNYEYKNKIKITSPDGIKISANLLIPKQVMPKQGWPTIIFANSWLMDEHEFLVQATKLAKDGFQILSYSMRGWGCSEGELDILGPNDIKDIKSIINWIRDNTDVDMKNIAMSGISYGGGMSLMALAHESRIKTAVAMSSWGSLTEALYKDNTPRKFWTNFLVSTSKLLASPSDEMLEMVSNLFKNESMEETIKWTQVRNPINYIEKINKRNAPVYIANNFGDNLFTPNNAWNYFNKLTVPKRLDLNQGSHASGEGFGLIGLDAYAWDKAFAWFNYHLKGKVISDDMKSKNIVTVLTDLKHIREVYDGNKINNLAKETFYFSPRKLYRSGKLLSSRYKEERAKNTISNRFNSYATTGIPFLSAILDGNLKVPVISFLPSILWHHGISFNTETMEKGMQIRGIPEISVNITPNNQKVQLIAYLYHKDKYGYGRLITHGSKTLHYAKVGEEINLKFTLNATAYDIPKGDKVTLVIDTQDALYLEPTDSFYTIEFDFNKSRQSTLTLPIK